MTPVLELQECGGRVLSCGECVFQVRHGNNLRELKKITFTSYVTNGKNIKHRDVQDNLRVPTMADHYKDCYIHENLMKE